MTFLINILSIAYASMGVFAAIGYYPTIRDLWHHKKPSANTNSYLIWSLTSLVTFLYSIFVLPDWLFRFVSTVNLVCCAIIYVLMLVLEADMKRKKKRR